MSESCPTCPKAKTELEDIECLTDMFRLKETCFTPQDVGANIFCQLKDIALAIREYSEIAAQKGYASALLHFSIPATVLTDGQLVNQNFSRSPFNYKVTGWGVSCISWPASAGAYTDDDSVQIKLYDFTAAAQIGNTLVLNPSQLHDKHTDEGNPIGNNISNGHIYGIKMTYDNTDAGAFTSPIIHVYIHVEPAELVTEV